MSKTILFRCDASSSIGYGHLTRCISLAQSFLQTWACDVYFAIYRDSNSHSYVSNSIESAVVLQPPDSIVTEEDWTIDIINKIRPSIALFDIRSSFDLQSMHIVKNLVSCLVVIDDSSERRLAADLVFYPPVRQVRDLDWKTFSGRTYVGWNFIPIRQVSTIDNSSFNRISYKNGARNILLSMGASDPNNLLLTSLQSLEHSYHQFDLSIIIGPRFRYLQDVVGLSYKSKHNYSLITGCTDLYPYFFQSDLAVIAFGSTAYECALAHTPSVHLCCTVDHYQSSLSFQDAGMAHSFMLAESLTYQPLPQK